MENKTKKEQRFRLNIIDVLLVLIIVAALALIVYIFSSDNSGKKNETMTIQYQLEVQSMREEWQGLIQIGDKVFDSTTQVLIGEVVDVSYAPYVFIGFNDELGEVVYSDYPDHVNMTVTISSKAEKSAEGYVINGCSLKVGEDITFRTPKLSRQGNCVEIQEKGEVISNG